MEADAGFQLKSLRVDGGMVRNETLMQFQTDLLGVPVIRPQITETTALGVGYAAGLATGFWKDMDELYRNRAPDRAWQPNMDRAQRDALFQGWKRAVIRTFDWIE
jgi:glycerol kinase